MPTPPHPQKMYVGRSGPLHRLPLQAPEWNRHTHFATIKTAGEELLTLSRNAEKTTSSVNTSSIAAVIINKHNDKHVALQRISKNIKAIKVTLNTSNSI